MLDRQIGRPSKYIYSLKKIGFRLVFCQGLRYSLNPSSFIKCLLIGSLDNEVESTGTMHCLA